MATPKSASTPTGTCYRRTLFLVSLLLMTTFSGCVTGVREYFRNGLKVGPNYCPPEAAVADHWIDFANDPSVDGEPRWDWWRAFNDPKLDELIYIAHAQNLSLREAGFRIHEARALRAIAAGNFFPQSQIATGAYSRQMLSLGTGVQAGGGAGFPGITRYFSVWNAGTQFAWELDFWGRYRRAIEAADAQLDASVENYDDVLTILLGEVGNAYVEIRTVEQRIRYAEANIKAQSGSLEVAQNRLEGGVASKLDVTQAITNLGQTEATIPDLQRQMRQAENRLCVLLGIPPQDIRPLLGPPGQIPPTPAELVFGIPADLLRRRPDVRRAEREIAAQSARIGIAETDLYPAFTINGNLFVRSTDFQNLFNSQSVGGSVGPSFSWNVLNYGRILNNVAAEEARFMQEVTQYQTVVLNANREAEDAIVAFLQAQQQALYLRKATSAAVESRDLVQSLYQGGKADFGRVYVSELVLAQQQDALAIAEGAIASSLVDIYRALGGGWQLRLYELPPMSPVTPPATEDIPPPPPPPPAPTTD
jgi:NodT family efflux transporter outer membrane factor (OMF) lipoprotein